MKNFHSDLIWSVLLIVLSIAIYGYSGTFDSVSEAVHPLAKSSVYSRIWAVVLFLLSLALLLRTLKKRDMAAGAPLFTFAMSSGRCDAFSYYIIDSIEPKFHDSDEKKTASCMPVGGMPCLVRRR